MSPTVSIPVTAWSSAPIPSWLVSVHLESAAAGGKLGPMVAAGGVTVTSALGVGNPECAGGLRQAVNECEGATLYVSAPPGASSGDFALISLHSIREDNTRNQPLHEDFYHFIPVGIYVP